MDFDAGFVLNLIYGIIIIVVVAVLLIIANRYLFKFLRIRFRKSIVLFFEMVIALLIISFAVGSIASLYGFREVFIVVFGLFILGVLAIIIGSRHVLEEYMSGVLAIEIHDLRVGDYIEVDHVRGYIVALNETSVVVRDMHRDLVYIPYTKLLHSPFKRFRVEEGHEIVIPIVIPYVSDLAELRNRIMERARELGIENVRISIESLSEKSIRLIIRGIIRDLRREEEIRYSMLDEIYSRAFQKIRENRSV